MAAESAHIPEIQAYPREIGRYEIISTLGVGASSRVYLALQRGARGTTRLLAVKRLRAEVTSDVRQLSALAADARVGLRLEHANVVRTYEVVAEPSGLFVVLEVLRGLTLAEILRRLGRERVPLDEHLWILTRVLAGLHYAHALTDERGTPLAIVHRGLSPSSVFVTYSGEVKLLEFGMEKATLAIAENAVGAIKQKLAYASPEQCMAGSVDAQADVYSVGVMLWEALARQRRPAKANASSLIRAQAPHTGLPIELLWPEVPAELARITRHALHLAPNERSSALSMKRALESYLRTSKSPAGPKNVAAFMSAHFHKDLAKFQETVDSYLRSTREPNAGSAAPSSSRGIPSAQYEFENDDEEDMKTVRFSGAMLSPRLRYGEAAHSTLRSRSVLAKLALAAAFVGAFLTAWLLARSYSSPSPAAHPGPGVTQAATGRPTTTAKHLPRKDQ